MRFRALPPAGGFLSPLGIIWTLLDPSSTDVSSLYLEHKIYFLNSGKSSLLLFFQALKKIKDSQEIAMSAYTCPDIAAAAIRAGYKIRVLDVDPDTTGISVTKAKVENCAAVVLSNLYGITDSVEPDVDCLVVDDACQGALSFRGSDKVGISSDKIGVFSFGRGKAYCGAGGGMLLVPKSYLELNQEICRIYEGMKKETLLNALSLVIKSLVFWILEHPIFYRIVLSLPGLKIGETNVNCNFRFLKGLRIRKNLLVAFVKFEDLKREGSQKQVKRYEEALSKLSNSHLKHPFRTNENQGLIRYPLLLGSEKIEKIFSSSKSKLKYLGITRSYPKTLRNYFKLEEFAGSSEVTYNAELVAKTILTLPIGPYVTEADVKEIVETFK